jgi:hypothetical protein
MSEPAFAPEPPAAAPAPAEPSSDHRGRIVVLAGSATTLVALAGVFAAARHGENIMGWYANYVIPAGALLVGLVAASGYGIAGWVTGLKMTPKLIASVVLELTVSYFIAHYSEFSRLYDDASIGDFFRWFDESTRAFCWSDHGKVGEPLGLLGYGLRALELVGFVGGGAAVPIILRAKPYCDPCRIYKRTRSVVTLAAGVPQGVFKRSSQEERDAAMTGAIGGLNAILDAAGSGDRTRMRGELAARAAGKGAHKLTAHVLVSLQRCPRCSDGALVASLVLVNGNQRKIQKLKTLPLSPDQLRPLFD